MKSWRRLAETAAALLVLYFVAAYLAAHWREVREYPWEIAVAPLVAATLLAALSLCLFAALWRALLRAMGEKIGRGQALSLWFVSNLARYVPGKVWQLFGMAYLARRLGVRATQAVGASLLLQMLAVSTGILLLVSTLPAEMATISGPGLRIGLALAGAAIVGFYVSPLFDAAAARALALLGQPAAPARLSLGQKLLLGCGTLFAWVIYGAGFWLFLRGTAGRTPPLPAALGICVAGYLAGFFVFFAPGGLGVREGLYALLLGSYLPGSVALAVALLNRLWITAIELGLAGLTTALAHRERLPLAASAGTGASSDG